MILFPGNGRQKLRNHRSSPSLQTLRMLSTLFWLLSERLSSQGTRVINEPQATGQYKINIYG